MGYKEGLKWLLKSALVERGTSMKEKLSESDTLQQSLDAIPVHANPIYII